ncbi:hypothetical protein HHK36_005564 [Tetracentron sinense]|uniref:Gnk2-homologous domain-containing protein n=1 Tax=Tetracentron sinense TaxID=13715 RepID=A0A835DMF3_TETSI|nr:hypothetical protein HHK36_005564 [Tetracentron sinense]
MRNLCGTAIQNIEHLCSNRKEAIVWEEYCQLRYSNRGFFGQFENSHNLTIWNKKNVTEPDLYRSIVREMLGNLSKHAAFDPSASMFATGEADFTNNDKVYGFVQCTGDLSGNACNRCLETAIIEILSCCYFKRGARLLSSSCYLRYELYPFYQGSSGLEGSPLSPSIPTTIPDKPRKKDMDNCNPRYCISVCSSSSPGFRHLLQENEFTIQEAPLAVAGGPASTDIAYQNIQERDQMKSQDFPLIDFATISIATDNFSDSNMLGQGGFGPVYKVVASTGLMIFLTN